MRKLNYILISLMILLSLAGTQALAQKFGDISDEEWATGAPEDYPEANVVILFDKAMMEVSLEGISYQRHLRMKVLNKAGVEEAA